MIKKILLNNSELKFTEKDLPILIHGEPGTGSSLFTVSLVSQFYNQGSKILFLSGYQAATDEFKSQVGDIDPDKVEIVQRGREEDFLKVVSSLKDLDERVILIKNVELLSSNAFQAIKDKQKFIISGDIKKCSFKDELINFPFKTTILFSQLENKTLPSLQKYEGYMRGENAGIVKVEVRA